MEMTLLGSFRRNRLFPAMQGSCFQPRKAEEGFAVCSVSLVKSGHILSSCCFGYGHSCKSFKCLQLVAAAAHQSRSHRLCYGSGTNGGVCFKHPCHPELLDGFVWGTMLRISRLLQSAGEDAQLCSEPVIRQVLQQILSQAPASFAAMEPVHWPGQPLWACWP